MRYLVTQARRQWYPLRRPCLHLCVCMYVCVSLLAPWNTLRRCCGFLAAWTSGFQTPYKDQGPMSKS